MISVSDLYHVLTAVVPLYVAMVLAYGSVKWWKIFTPDQCSGINRFVALFAVPLLSFHFISTNNPYAMNLRFIAADTLQKLLVLSLLSLWSWLTSRGGRGCRLEWAITLFSLSTLPNTLVMGIPLLKGMYGDSSGALMVQIVVLQCIIWYTLMLFLFEYRGAKLLIMEQFPDTGASIISFRVDSDILSLDGKEPLQTDAELGEDGKLHVTVRKSTSSSRDRSDIFSGRSHGHGGGHHSGGLGLGGMSSVTPRASNLTNAEIYSLQSSRNPTPRGSSFNHTDTDFVNGGRSSNFDFGGNASQLLDDLERADCATNVSNSNGLFAAPAGGKKAKEKENHNVLNGSREGGKDLHMFVWSSSASPVSEGGGLPVFRGGLAEFGNEKINTGGEYGRDEFSFRSRPMALGVVEDTSMSTQRDINIARSNSTAELHPKASTTRGGDGDLKPTAAMPPASVMTRLILIMVWRKLIRNPNTYSSLLGLIWSLVSFRWGIVMPAIIARSIAILSDAGLGMAMFSLGLFMALQPRIIACGNTIAAFAMGVRFITGPAVMAVASIAVGLRGVLLHIAIVQAALPQGIVPFVFAKEYNVHPDILSTGVIFGMLIALPITLVYYILLGL